MVQETRPPSFRKVDSLGDVREHKYALTPGHYVGAEEAEEDDEGFEEKMHRLVGQLGKEMAKSARLDEELRTNLKQVGLSIRPAQ